MSTGNSMSQSDSEDAECGIYNEITFIGKVTVSSLLTYNPRNMSKLVSL